MPPINRSNLEVAILGLILAIIPFQVCAAQASPATHPVYGTCPRSADGIGKVYMGREIASVMGHEAARWLERPEREREEEPQKVINAMDLRGDETVADIGAGSGHFSFRIAARLPKGKVLAEDIQPEMLDIIRNTSKARGILNVEPVLGTVTDPKMADNSVDVVLFLDSYHEFDHPRHMMEAIVTALKPGGRVIEVEYRGEDPQVHIKPHHKMTEAQAKLEMAAVGLAHRKTVEDLPLQQMMIFEKPK